MKRCTICLVLIVISSLFLLATEEKSIQEEKKKEKEKPLHHHVVVTATRTEQPAMQVASSASIITSRHLRQKKSPTLSEALNQVVGLDVAESGGLGKGASIFIRGANSEHTLVMVDGVDTRKVKSVYDLRRRIGMVFPLPVGHSIASQKWHHFGLRLPVPESKKDASRDSKSVRCNPVYRKAKFPVIKGHDLSHAITIDMTDSRGAPPLGLQPVEVRITDPDGETNATSDYYCAENGRLTVDFTPAVNDTRGRWTVAGADLTAGLQAEAGFEVVD